MKQQRSYPAVQVTAKGERAIKNGHPWVYGAELTGQTGTPENGGLVDVFAGSAYMGTGFYNERSKITVRLLSRNANDRFDAAFWRRRVAYAIAYRKTVMPGADFQCCRLIHGEADQMPWPDRRPLRLHLSGAGAVPGHGAGEGCGLSSPL